MSFSTNDANSLNRYKKPTGPSQTYDIDGYDIRPKAKPLGKSYASVPSSYEPVMNYK